MSEKTAGRRFSARRGLVLGLGGVAVLIGGFAGWGVFASISGAIIATGRVAVESRNQSIERIEGGTVREVLVRDGDIVARDQPLLRFADARLRSEAAILEAQFAELAALRNRLEAEFRGTDTILWDTELLSLSRTSPAIRDVLEGQERLFRAREAARAGEVALLRERIGQTREEIAGLEARAVSLEQQSALIVRELDVNRETFDKGLTRLDRLLALERAARNLEGTAGTNAASIARTRGRIAELELQILQVDARRIEEAEEQARNAKAKENQVRERLAQVHGSLESMEVRAPVPGIVFGMTVFAPGEVVQPGEPILQIVPEGADLVIIAQIQPMNVDQVYPGQEAVLRFTAFPLQVTPEREGRVVRVSADTVHDKESGKSWYEVELAMGRPAAAGGASGPGPNSETTRTGLEGVFADLAQALGVGGSGQEAHSLAGELALTPGMPVEVHIRTGDRSVISYLAKPVTDFFQRSMREE